MKRIIDLTHTIKADMSVFPGDPNVEFSRVISIHEGGYNISRVSMGTHTGTHVDVLCHVMHDSRGVDLIPLDSLVGWTEVLDFGDVAPGAELTSADFDRFASRICEGARILLKTGWGKHWAMPEFYSDFPGISEGAAAWLVARKIKLIAIEQPSLHAVLHRELHKALLASGIVVLENIANANEITAQRIFLAALPIKLAGMDGAPTRVIAIEGIEDAAI